MSSRSRYQIVKEGWDNRPNFQHSHGLKMTPDDIDEGNDILRKYEEMEREGSDCSDAENGDSREDTESEDGSCSDQPDARGHSSPPTSSDDEADYESSDEEYYGDDDDGPRRFDDDCDDCDGYDDYNDYDDYDSDGGYYYDYSD